jgi:4-hydroxy-tetrahydrodipicolinate synthase
MRISGRLAESSSSASTSTRGDLEAAKRLDQELAAAYELIGVTTGPIQIKAALNLLGHEVGGLRLPLVEASEDEVVQIRGCLERLKLLEPARA